MPLKAWAGWKTPPIFDSMAVDERGLPLRIAVPDPRVFAIHKSWLSGRPDREPVKRARDVAQAAAVAQLVSRHLTHLAYEPNELAAVPKKLFEEARPLFAAGPA